MHTRDDANGPMLVVFDGEGNNTIRQDDGGIQRPLAEWVGDGPKVKSFDPTGAAIIVRAPSTP